MDRIRWCGLAFPIALALTHGPGASVAPGWPVPARVDATGMVRVEAGGFEVRVAIDLVGEPELCARVLRTLRSDLAMVERVVSEPVLAVLRERTIIWIERQGAIVPGGMSGRGMVFHPSAFWLRANGLDPARAGGVEIVRAEDYLAWRETQPMMVLHELAHAYQHLLGEADAGLMAAYRAASESGRYDAVRRAGRPEEARERAYAMGNIREYFAELSEAYFGRNDYEPFDRDELRVFDPEGFAAVERLWGLGRDALDGRAESTGAPGDE